MFEKTRVGEGVADPMCRVLTEQTGEFPRWNFHKYLDRWGRLVGSFSSGTEPDSKQLLSAIENEL